MEAQPLPDVDAAQYVLPGMQHSAAPPRSTLELWRQAVKRCELFWTSSPAELEYISQTTKVVKCKAGDVVYAQNDPVGPAALFCLVHSGSFQATISSAAGGEWVAREYGPLDNFGACELLTAHVGGRVCTIRATENSVYWGVPKHVVDQKLRVTPARMAERNAELVEFCATRVRLFASVPRERLSQLMRGAVTLELAPEERLVREGAPARAIFLVRDGHVVSSREGAEQQLQIYAPDTLGESALFGDNSLRIRGASVHAGKWGATVVRFPVLAIETLMGFELHTRAERLYNRKMLESVKLGGRVFVAGLSVHGVEALLDAMSLVTFKRGRIVAKEGVCDETLYLVRRGGACCKLPLPQRASAYSPPPQEGAQDPAQRPNLALFQRGDLFGEQALLGALKDSDKKQPRRKSDVFADADEGLDALAITPASIQALPELRTWLGELTADIAANCVGGIDASLILRASEIGLDAQALLMPGKKSDKQKNRKQELGLKGAAKKAPSEVKV